MSKKITHGGKRKGAGRKLGSGTGRKVSTRSISMLHEVWEQIDADRGGLSRGKYIESIIPFDLRAVIEETDFLPIAERDKVNSLDDARFKTLGEAQSRLNAMFPDYHLASGHYSVSLYLKRGDYRRILVVADYYRNKVTS